MNGLNKKNMRTMGFMMLFAVVIISSYYYLSTRREEPKDTSGIALTEYQQIMGIDLEQNYPATPREVVKLLGRIIKYLYNEPAEDEIKPLALKARGLYDKELLADNPEDEYINNLVAELASWRDKNRKITNYLLVNEDMEQDTEVDGVKYAVRYISYTIKEKGKFTETWRVLLRQDEDGKWKVVGWEFVPADDEKDDKK